MMPLDGSARFRYRLDVPVGRKEGSPDNLIVGICDGLTEGIPDGMNRDISVGFEEGTSKGASDVFNLGNSVGAERVCLSEILLGCDDGWSYCEERHIKIIHRLQLFV
mmetsp:Transcript_25899/g.54262  ORF Transcript_25899/g.54262 Transcript_25899/m.54262 type:complete len:107 (+) Transcript_25899:201-521(+)